MLNLMRQKPIIEVIRISIVEGESGRRQADVKKRITEQLMLNRVLKEKAL